MAEERYCIDCYAANKGPVVATKWDDEDPLCFVCFSSRTARTYELDGETEVTAPVTKAKKSVPRKKELTMPVKSPVPVSGVGGPERSSAVTLTLQSGGTIRMELNCHLFNLSPRDRKFVFSIADMMHSYEEGTERLRNRPARTTSEGEKMFLVKMPLSYLQDMFEQCAEDDARAATYAAWLRDDPATKPATTAEAK